MAADLTIGMPVVTRRVPPRGGYTNLTPEEEEMLRQEAELPALVPQEPEQAEIATKVAGESIKEPSFFAKMLAQKATAPVSVSSLEGGLNEEQMLEALKAAQRIARGNKRDAMLMGAGQDFADAMAGRKRDGSFEASLMAQAEQPVESLAQEQVLQRGISKDKADRDMRVRELVLREQGLANEANKIRAMREEAAAKAAEELRRRKEDRDNALRDKADQRDYETKRDARQAGAALQRARVLAGLKPGAQLPAGEAAEIAGLEAAQGTLDDLWSAYNTKASEWYSGATQHLPGSKAAQYTDLQKAAAQTIGTIMEGGKLTDADLQKYMKLMPSPSDTDERAAAKKANLEKMLKTSREAKLRGAGQAGFNVKGFPAENSGAGGGRMRPTNGGYDLSGEDNAALDWARKHRDDPRAKEILRINGIAE